MPIRLRLPSLSSLHLPRCLQNLPLPRLRLVPRRTQCIELVDLDLTDAAFRYQLEHRAWMQSPPAPPNSPVSLDLVDEGSGWGRMSGEDLGGLDGFSFLAVARTARGRLGRNLDTVRNHNRNLDHDTTRPLHDTPAAPPLAPAQPQPPPMNNPAHPPRWRCCRCNHINIPTATSTTTSSSSSSINYTNNTTTPTFHLHSQANDGATLDTGKGDASRTHTCPCGHGLEPCLLKARLRILRKVQRRGGELGVAFVRG